MLGFGSITFLSTLAFYGKVRLNLRRFLVCISGFVLFASVLSGLVWGLREWVQPKTPDLLPSFTLPRDVTYGIDAKIFRSRDEWNKDGPGNGIQPVESTMARIARTKTLRVGYNAQVTPFAYFNEKGELVGYDMAYAYDLARSLNVRLQLIPFDWNTLTSDLENNRLDILMSALYITEERLKRLMVSQSYFRSPAALIVPSRRADQFLSASGIQIMDHLTLAALNVPVARSFVQQTFPNAKVIVLNSYDELPRHPEVDAGLWTLVQGAVWSQSHPGYTAVVPRNFGSVMVFGYLMPPGAEALARFVNYWLDLRKADGFEKKQHDYWIQGKPRKDSKHRWCIIRNVLHWVD